MQLPRPPRSAGSHPIDTFIYFGAYFHNMEREIISFCTKSYAFLHLRAIDAPLAEYLRSELERLREKLSRFYRSCMKLLHLSIWYIKLFTIVDYVSIKC